MTYDDPGGCRILVLEDEQSLREDLVEYLLARGYSVVGAASKGEFEACRARQEPDIVLLDINLPDGDGYGIARELRATVDPGIIMISSRSSLEDRIAGLDCGADAYLVKHADLREIEATIRMVSRRRSAAGAAPADSWGFDPLAWLLTSPDGRKVQLTTAEVAFMGALLTRPGSPCSRQEIARALSRQSDQIDRSIDSLVKRLRKKVEAATGTQFPVSVAYGVGYAFTAHILVKN